MEKFKKVNKVPKLNLATVSKFWEREYTIFTMSAWRLTFGAFNSKWLKNCFSISICFYSKGVATHFRSRQEEEDLEAWIGEKMIHNKSVLKKVVNSHTKGGERLKNLYKQIDRKNKFEIKFVKDFNESFGKFVVFNTFVQRVPDYISKTKNKSRKYKNIANLLIRSRTKYEPVIGNYEKYLDKLCKKIGEERKIKNPELLKMLTIDEFIDFLETNQLPGDLEQRYNMSALIILPQPRLLIGQPAANLFKKLKNQEDKFNKSLFKDKEIKGIPIYAKKIKGRVQVIKDLKDLTKFKKGNILVTPTTLPPYNNILITAKGIITDEGGLLSHAAVISREFKIPGIVGTRVATQRLKTGQLVELDAIKGVVKILE